MLKSFSVKNYKNFKDVLTLDLTPNNYEFNNECVKNNLLNKAFIVGINGSGKTNLGYAMFDIARTLLLNRPENESRDNTFLNADSEEDYATFIYEFIFDGRIIRYEYHKTDPFKITFESLHCNNELIYRRDHDRGEYNGLRKEYAPTLNIDIKDGHVSVLGYVWSNTQQQGDSPICCIIDFVKNMRYIKSDTEGYKFIGMQFNQKDVVEYIVSNGLIDDFRKMLNEIARMDVKFDVSDDIIKNGLLMQKFRTKDLNFAKIASSGTRVFLMFYYWYRIHPEMSLLYMDEFDAFYHFEMAEKMMRMLIGKGYQVIFTSHNTSLISNDILRPDCYFRINDGHISSFSDSTERKLREGHNIQKLYRNGEFDD